MCDTRHLPSTILEKAGIRPTANRLLILRELLNSDSPLSLTDLECRIETIDKSGIFRALTLFLGHSVVHTVEDGGGGVRYEICHGTNECSVEDMHVHFYCEQCHRVVCFEKIPIPFVELPAEYEVRKANYMLKGLCPDCRKRLNQ